MVTCVIFTAHCNPLHFFNIQSWNGSASMAYLIRVSPHMQFPGVPHGRITQFDKWLESTAYFIRVSPHNQFTVVLRAEQSRQIYPVARCWYVRGPMTSYAILRLRAADDQLLVQCQYNTADYSREIVRGPKKISNSPYFCIFGKPLRCQRWNILTGLGSRVQCYGTVTYEIDTCHFCCTLTLPSDNLNSMLSTEQQQLHVLNMHGLNLSYLNQSRNELTCLCNVVLNMYLCYTSQHSS